MTDVDLSPSPEEGRAPLAKPVVLRTHLSLWVSDMERSSGFFCDVLDMKVTARGPQWIFLSYGRKHHDLALIQAPDGSAQGTLGMQHYGLEIEGDLDQLRRLHAMLLSKGVTVVKTTDHKVGFGLYFEDPDGNRFEFFAETVHDDEEGIAVLGQHNAPSEPFVIDPLYT